MIRPGNRIAVALAGLFALAASPVAALPAFSISASPGSIGPGSTSTLTYTIDNSAETVPATSLAFTHTLAGDVVLASPPSATTDCTGGAVTATGGGTSVTFSGGSVGGPGTCTVTVNVTKTLAGSTDLTTGDLTSSAGNSGTATAALAVDSDAPAFTKAFSPATVSLGGTSTLTFTIDHTAGAASGSLTGVNFTDNLPLGVAIASPSNFSSTCSSVTVVADPGTSVIDMIYGTLIAGVSCAISVDVVANAVGTHVNVSGELTGSNSVGAFTSGVATASLTVDPLSTSAPTLTKSFIDDPVIPGQTATLSFTILNPDRDFAATSIAFTDDLDAMLTGATLVGAPIADPCGTGSTITGTSLLTFAGGSLAANTSCTFDVTVQLPATAAAAGYLNTTSNLTATVNGDTATNSPATDTLAVSSSVPLSIAKSFGGTAVPGGTVTLDFTLTNPNAGFTATSVAFSDDLYAVLPNLKFDSAVPANIISNTCGGTPSHLFTQDSSSSLEFSGGTVASGSSCTLSVSLDMPAVAANGSYVNITEPVMATLDGATQTGNTASDLLVVDAGVSVSFAKTFGADEGLPDSSVTLEFLITNTSETTSTTDISFSDDLDAFHSGATLTSVDANTCGGTVTGTGTGLIGFSGRDPLAVGGACTISTTAKVGPSPSGVATNTTSELTAGADGGTPAAVTGTAASDDFNVTDVLALQLTKVFSGDPVVAGDSVSLTFTITNPNAADDAIAVGFDDNLGAVVPGMSVTGGAPTTNTCGFAMAGTSDLQFTGGAVTGGSFCTLVLDMVVPASASDGDHVNTTTAIIGSVGGATRTGNMASDTLTVISEPLLLTKTFTGDPVFAGKFVGLDFTIQNTSGSTVSSIAFTDDIDAVLPGSLGYIASNSCGGSTLGGAVFALNFGTLAPGASCTIGASVLVPASAASGDYVNTVSDLTGMIGASAVTGSSASDTLRVFSSTSPTFSKTFLTNPVESAGTTTLEFTIANPATGGTLSNLAFSDDLDAALAGLVATGLPLNDVCGAGSAITGTSPLLFTGGSLGAAESCTFSVDLQLPATVAGTFTNTTGNLLENGLSIADPATDDLTVTLPPPGFAKAFGPSTISVGGTSTLTFTIDNTPGPGATSGLEFRDTLPPGMAIASTPNAANTCAGTLDATGGAGSVGLVGGSVAAASTCTISVDVTATSAGSLVNLTDDLTSSLGNSGTATATLTATASTTADITIVQTADTDDTFNFTSSEASLTFAITTVGGAGLEGPVTLTAGNYTVTQTLPSGFGNESITCSDANSTGDTTTGVLTLKLEAGESVVCTFNSRESGTFTSESIEVMIRRRVNFLLSNQPSRGRRFGRLGGGDGASQNVGFLRGDLESLLPFTVRGLTPGSDNFSVSSSLAQARMAAARVDLSVDGSQDATAKIYSSDFDVWMEASYNQFDALQGSQGHFAVGYLGADWLVNPDLLVGALIQFDSILDFSNVLNNTSSGAGWMVGPYVTARLGSGLYFDGRIAAGQSNNRISPFNTYTDSFNTSRWLIDASLTGNATLGNWKMQPNASLSFMSETQAAYVDSLMVLIPSQTVAQGQLRFGPNFSTMVEGKHGEVYYPRLSLDGIFNFSNATGTTLAGTTTDETSGWRARFEAGILIVKRNGIRVDINTNLDGLGKAGYQSYGGSVRVTIPLQ